MCRGGSAEIDVEGFRFVHVRPWFAKIEPRDDDLPGNSDEIPGVMGSLDHRLLAETEVNLIFGT